MPAQLLLPANNLGKEKTKFQIAQELGLWGLTGALVHTFALGIQNKPVLKRPQLHFVWAAVFVGIGYGAIQFEDHYMKKLEMKRDLLVKRRMQRLAAE
ncbi:hypothetical protein HK103_004799 [Boothiomyces macroporosus]|uniref:Uncharacterized protein n=1 Tax=Boothiomyces macroporosus TaxID=261099 RepID=A0AAD5UKH7_9FUNG|nr:hypothetical protein HK103_004799 [Boothiomyces macroporosus]